MDDAVFSGVGFAFLGDGASGFSSVSAGSLDLFECWHGDYLRFEGSRSSGVDGVARVDVVAFVGGYLGGKDVNGVGLCHRTGLRTCHRTCHRTYVRC